MTDPSDLRTAAEAMRRDWDRRARQDALHYVYTRDSTADEPDFDESGRANYNQLVRPYLPLLLDGRPSRDCRVLEIGCGVGRMTRWFAASFGEVVGVDVSEEMIARARERLRDTPNAVFMTGSGYDLAGLPDESFDLAFSYIVFQHVPLRGAIENYVREAFRVLKPGGAFKFQLNGDASAAAGENPADTWLGATFEMKEARAMLRSAGFTLMAAEGIGTQYFILTARKGPETAAPGMRSYILPGEDWAAKQLLEGWGDVVDHSWRPVAARSDALFAAPKGTSLRFFAAAYFWPGPPFATRRLVIHLDGAVIGELEIAAPGDHYIELPVSTILRVGGPVRVTLEIQGPPNSPQPAMRSLGIYASSH